MSDGPPTPKRMRIDVGELDGLSKEDLIEKLKTQEKYVKLLESQQKSRGGDDEDVDVQDSEDKLRQQQREATRRENTLVHRLTTKEQELQDYMNQIQELKQAQTQSTAQLRSMLLDPAINLVFQRMGKEMDDCQEKLKQTQNELSAWKFTPDSQTGKRLMAKCRMLLQENEELGKVIASGRTAKLEGEIALQKTLVQEMKQNQTELEEFLSELEEDVEGMQSMIYVLQQQLKETKEQLAKAPTQNNEEHLVSETTDSTVTDYQTSAFVVSNSTSPLLPKNIATISSQVETSSEATEHFTDSTISHVAMDTETAMETSASMDEEDGQEQDNVDPDLNPDSLSEPDIVDTNVEAPLTTTHKDRSPTIQSHGHTDNHHTENHHRTTQCADYDSAEEASSDTWSPKASKRTSDPIEDKESYKGRSPLKEWEDPGDSPVVRTFEDEKLQNGLNRTPRYDEENGV